MMDFSFGLPLKVLSLSSLCLIVNSVPTFPETSRSSDSSGSGTKSDVKDNRGFVLIGTYVYYYIGLQRRGP